MVSVMMMDGRENGLTKWGADGEKFLADGSYGLSDLLLALRAWLFGAIGVGGEKALLNADSSSQSGHVEFGV